MGVDILNTYLGLLVLLKVFIAENGFFIGEEFFSLVGKAEYAKFILRYPFRTEVVEGCSESSKETL